MWTGILYLTFMSYIFTKWRPLDQCYPLLKNYTTPLAYSE